MPAGYVKNAYIKPKGLREVYALLKTRETPRVNCYYISVPGVPGVSGVPGASGVSGVPGVPGVPAVSGVSAASAVPGVSATTSLRIPRKMRPFPSLPLGSHVKCDTSDH